MIEASVAINAIILYCDESLLNVRLGKNYRVVKTYIDDLPFKNKIIDGRGHFSISYLGSLQQDNNGQYFICLKKDAIHPINNPITVPGSYTNEDFMCSDQIKEYTESEWQYLHMVFSLLRLFREGNIGTKEVFFDYDFQMGFVRCKPCDIKDSIGRNIIDRRIFTLSDTELQQCNQFIAEYSGNVYLLMKNCINEFIHGLEQIDIATGFEQYTTTLEMTLIGHDQQGKKEVLSKRISVMLETDPERVNALYQKLKTFYRYRSESLHEGHGENISYAELYEMENITRCVLKKCLKFCKAELNTNPSVTWQAVKEKIISELKRKVASEIEQGRFVD